MTRTWQLFIDESGNFNDRGATCVVAGVLVEAAAHPRHDAQVRAALVEACPGLDYPYHASTAAYLTGRMCATLLSTQRTATRPTPARELAVRARESLVQLSDAPVAAQLLRELEAARLPDHALLRDADRLLEERAREVWTPLKALVVDDQHRMRQVLRRAGELFGAKGPDGAFIVTAVDAPGGGASDEVEDPVVDRDRYLALLRVLLGRVGALLHARASEVWVTAAMRNVARRDVGDFPLNTVNVRAASTSARRLPQAEPPTTAIRFVPAGVPRYRADVSPGIVLADFTSNRVRQSVLGGGGITWESLARRIKDRVAMEPSWAPGFGPDRSKLPTLAETGRAEAAIWRAFDGQAMQDDLRDRPRWAREQARLWIQAGAAWRQARGLA